jgi:RNA polymerase sigma-54 factor|uniref:RNA polymerase sigma-54 factor n=1 Tax=candidate division WOR-3 bacterium TaxID=2052148 RepID=A0A7C4TID7_UNCW3
MAEKSTNLTQGLKLTPSLIHTLAYYLKLLEMPSIELEVLIRDELDRNPLLEEVEEESEATEVETENKEEFELLDLYASDDIFSLPQDSDEEKPDPFENTPAHNDRLYDHLMRQAKRKLSERELEIAELIISNLDEDGYLTLAPEELAGEDYSIEEIEKIRRIIQSFEPVGCAWRDVREPLIAQLIHLGYAPDSVECRLVRDCLKYLRTGNLKQCQEILNVDEKRIIQAKQVIMKLDPKPGLQYSTIDPPYVYPDFIVYWQDNDLDVRLNEENIPRIRIKKEYLEKIKQDSEDAEFVREKLKSAQNLIRAIEKRRKTLTKIIKALLDYQKDYFLKGEGYLKSITIADFAKQLGMNPSTVSRAISGKYIESPRGIHKLKFFFSAPVANTEKAFIFDKIKEAIENEDKTSPLSDVQIAKKLARMGIIISRRTVAKYREMLNIPPHNLRRIQG